VKKIIKALLRMSYSAGMPVFLNRGEIPYILNRKGLVNAGVEVGVYYGQYSEYLLTHWKGKTLYSVDAWGQYVAPGTTTLPAEEFARIYESARRRLTPFGERSKIIRQLSTVAAQSMGDGTLDFVYLDAGHDYASVLEDLQAWAPKVRPGGMLAGHDYWDGSSGAVPVYGVKKAVDEFAKMHGLSVKVSLREPENCKSWLIWM